MTLAATKSLPLLESLLPPTSNEISSTAILFVRSLLSFFVRVFPRGSSFKTSLYSQRRSFDVRLKFQFFLHGKEFHLFRLSLLLPQGTYLLGGDRPSRWWGWNVHHTVRIIGPITSRRRKEGRHEVFHCEAH